MNTPDDYCSVCDNKGSWHRSIDTRDVAGYPCDVCGRSYDPAELQRINENEVNRCKGSGFDRVKDSPYEAAIFDAWVRENRPSIGFNGGIGTLKGLLNRDVVNGDPDITYLSQDIVEPSERDWFVASTVIQWLGTPCGRAFLMEAQRDGRARFDEYMKQRNAQHLREMAELSIMTPAKPLEVLPSTSP